MNLGRRFVGTGLAALALLLVIGLSWWVGGDERPPTIEPEVLFSFEKEDLVAFRVSRPDEVLAFEEVQGRWQVVGQRWRPSASLVRRVAHQLHDLTARAQVVETAEDLSRYGLGAGAIRVDFTLASGQERSFEVGDPNPSSHAFR